jgi:hypothetical protein
LLSGDQGDVHTCGITARCGSPQETPVPSLRRCPANCDFQPALRRTESGHGRKAARRTLIGVG